MAALGANEVERILQPVIDRRADRVYLLGKESDELEGGVAERLTEARIEYSIEPTDTKDLYSCMDSYRKIIHKEVEQHLYFNVSTGPKIACIAGMMAAMLWRGEPYYVSYEQKTIGDTISFPRFEMKKPEPPIVRFLSFIAGKPEGIKKTECIEELEELGFFDENITVQAKYGRVRNIIDPLVENWDAVEMQGAGRQSKFFLTSQGEKYVRILSGT